MITLFYLLLIIFAFNEVYYVFNKPRLDLNMKNRDVESTKSIDIAHYLLRILFWIWIVIGLWSSQSEMFMFLLITDLLGHLVMLLNIKLGLVFPERKNFNTTQEYDEADSKFYYLMLQYLPGYWEYFEIKEEKEIKKLAKRLDINQPQKKKFYFT